MNFPITVLRFIFRKKVRWSHVLAFLKYNSGKKIINLLRNQYEKRRGNAILQSKPYLINAEPTNHCNFRCPFCPTGKRSGRPTGVVDPGVVEKIFNQIGDYVYLVTLHGWGEPLLHHRLPKIIRSAHENRIFTVVTTNGSRMDAERSEALINSKLDYLICSVDGNSSETFSEYRKGGDYQKIIANLENLILLKKKMKSRTPFIEWQFLVFKHNEHEIKEARRTARKLGVDSFITMPAYTEDQRFDASDPRYHLPKGPPINDLKECNHLWSTLTFHWNGQVVPCCYDYPEEVSYGDLHTQRFEKIWNNSLFEASRSLVSGKSIMSDTPLYCFRCAGIELPTAMKPA